MTDAALVTRWTIGMACAIAVVLIVAVLLVRIIDEARSILAAARRCLRAVTAIRANVEPIWELKSTNEIAEHIAGAAQSIESKARLLGDTLEAHHPAPTATRS